MRPVPVRRRAGPAAVRASLVALAVAAGASSCRIVVEPEEPGLEESMEIMLRTSAAAWNDGDLEAFLSDYADAPTTTYIGAGGLIAGRDAIRATYAPAFAPGASRDSLRFESVRVRPLPPMAGVVTARWILHRGTSVTASGPFTLVVRRSGSGWKIIHDHSSSDAPAAPAGEAAGGTGGASDGGTGGAAAGPTE